MAKINKNNQNLVLLINNLKKLSNQENVKIWKSVAKNLEKSNSRKSVVNLSKINKYSRDKETVVVPGKVLGDGELTKDVKVAAFQFSETAKEKLKNRLSIEELMKQNPKGKNTRIIA